MAESLEVLCLESLPAIQASLEDRFGKNRSTAFEDFLLTFFREGLTSELSGREILLGKGFFIGSGIWIFKRNCKGKGEFFF